MSTTFAAVSSAVRSSIDAAFDGQRIHELIERRVERANFGRFVVGVEPALALLGGRARAHVLHESRERPEHRARDERRAERRDEHRERAVDEKILTQAAA